MKSKTAKRVSNRREAPVSGGCWNLRVDFTVPTCCEHMVADRTPSPVKVPLHVATTSGDIGSSMDLVAALTTFSRAALPVPSGNHILP